MCVCVRVHSFTELYYVPYLFLFTELYNSIVNTRMQAESLIQRMLAVDKDKSVANDTTTKQKIASFPPEIYDPDVLSQIKGTLL